MSRDRKAFALIELLVVISVIALLMGILLPILGRVRKQAQSVRCQANLKHLGMAVAVYVAENEGVFPERPTVRELPRVSRVWEHLLDRMAMEDKQDIMLCPVAKQSPEKQAEFEVPSGKASYAHGGTYHAWWYGGFQGTPEMRGSYGYNAYLYRFNEGRMTVIETRQNFWPAPAEIENPSTVPMMLDSQWLEAGSERRREVPPPSDNWALGTYDSSHFSSCINRHQGGVNAVFADHSVREVGLKELWTLKWSRLFQTANTWTKAGGVQPEDWPAWMRRFKDY